MCKTTASTGSATTSVARYASSLRPLATFPSFGGCFSLIAFIFPILHLNYMHILQRPDFLHTDYQITYSPLYMQIYRGD